MLTLSQSLALVPEARERGTHPTYAREAVLWLLIFNSISKSRLSSKWGMTVITASNTKREWKKEMGPFEF